MGDGVNPKYEFVLVACARWEETEIVEWVEYHRFLGFDHIYLYSNDDHYLTLYKTLLPYITGSDPYITFVHWTIPGQQLPMYADYLRHYKDESVWACFLDIDEFFVLKNVDNVKTFMRTFETEFDCVYFNWILYGSSGKEVRDNEFVLSTLTRRSARIDVHTKTVFRTSKVDAETALQSAARTGLAFTHFWNGYYSQSEFRMANVLGEDVSSYTDNFPTAALQKVQEPEFVDKIVEAAYIAHFKFKSVEDFLRRAERGGFPQQQIWKEMYDRGDHLAYLKMLNEVEDLYLKERWQRFMENTLRVQP